MMGVESREAHVPAGLVVPLDPRAGRSGTRAARGGLVNNVSTRANDGNNVWDIVQDRSVLVRCYAIQLEPDVSSRGGSTILDNKKALSRTICFLFLDRQRCLISRGFFKTRLGFLKSDLSTLEPSTRNGHETRNQECGRRNQERSQGKKMVWVFSPLNERN